MHSILLSLYNALKSYEQISPKPRVWITVGWRELKLLNNYCFPQKFLFRF